MHKFLSWLAAILIVIGIGCYFFEPYKSHLVNGYQPKITRNTIKNSHKHHKATYTMNNPNSATMQQVIKARAHAKQVEVDGQMLVPSVGLHLPVNEGVGAQSLLLGAGTMRPNEQMGQGNYALASHHMINKDALFTPLWFHAHKGTLVFITNMQTIYVYQIYKRQLISPYDVGVVNNTIRPIVTLITCNDSGSKRLLLRGKLVNQVPIKGASKGILRDINSRTNNHQVLKGY